MILEIILGLLCLVFLFVIINLTKKAEILEDRNEFYESYLNAFSQKVITIQQKLKDLDVRGSFSSDDEIGFFFTYVKDMNNELNQLIGDDNGGSSESGKSDETEE